MSKFANFRYFRKSFSLFLYLLLLYIQYLLNLLDNALIFDKLAWLRPFRTRFFPDASITEALESQIKRTWIIVKLEDEN